MSTLVFIVAGLTVPHHHAPPVLASWSLCRSDIGCHWYDMPRARHRPTGHAHWCTTSPAVTVCVTWPRFAPKPQPRPLARVVRPRATTAPVRVLNIYYLYTTYYCLTSQTASGLMAGPGIVASYILPWGAHVRDTYTGYEGYVWDHPDFLTAADEWLSCPRAFPTGVHKWVVLG